MNLEKVVSAVAAEIGQIVPPEVTATVALQCGPDDDLDAAVEIFLDHVQTEMAELTTEPWPALAPNPMPEPFAEISGGELRWGYGDLAAPLLDLPAIQIDELD